MRPIAISRVLASLALAVPSAAQAILVVDAAGGAGSQFTDIPPAIAAAAPGDRILVRRGAYSGFTTDKPLSIVGTGPGLASILFSGTAGASFVVRDLPAGTDFVMQRISASVPMAALIDCQGRVLLDDVACSAVVDVEDCAQVMLNRCDVTAFTITRSNVTMSDCGVGGGFASTAATAQAGISVTQAALDLARTDVAVPLLAPGGPAILLAGGQITLAGDASSIRAGPAGAPSFAAIAGAGTLLLDPDVVLSPTGSAPAIDPTVAVDLAELPTLAATGAALGGQLLIDLRGEAGDLFVMFVGIPGPIVPLPLFHGAFWIDPSSAIPVASGTLGPTQAHAVSLAVPLDFAFVGVPLGWVGIAGPNVSALRLTNNASQTQFAL